MDIDRMKTSFRSFIFHPKVWLLLLDDDSIAALDNSHVCDRLSVASISNNISLSNFAFFSTVRVAALHF
jgi:hypothetical protein